MIKSHQDPNTVFGPLRNEGFTSFPCFFLIHVCVGNRNKRTFVVKCCWNGFRMLESLRSHWGSVCIQDYHFKDWSKLIPSGQRLLSGRKDIILNTLQWCHYGRDGVSNHRRLDCLLHGLFTRRSKKAAKLRITGLCEGNPTVTGGFPSRRVTREMFPIDAVIVIWKLRSHLSSSNVEAVSSVIIPQIASYYMYLDVWLASLMNTLRCKYLDIGYHPWLHLIIGILKFDVTHD